MVKPKKSKTIRKYKYSQSALLVLAITAVVVRSFVGVVSAATSQLYLSPGSKNIVVGGTLSVAVRVNPGGDPVNAVQANLSYSADKLDFLSISAAGSAFEIQAESSGGAGSVRIARGTLNNVSADAQVATVSFKAKVDSGSAAISFAGGSAVVRATDNVNTLAGSSGGNYTFSKPAPVAPPPPPPPADKTPPVMSNIKTESVGNRTVTLAWNTDEPSTSIVEYGLDNTYGILAQTDGLTPNHKVVIKSPLLLPGVSYHYKVTSTDAAGNISTSGDMTFTMRGYKVQVTVVNQKNKPVRGATVVLSGKSVKTDDKGKVVFENQPAGERVVKVTSGRSSTETSIVIENTIKGEEETAVQTFSIKLKQGSNLWVIILPGILLLLILIVLLLLFLRRRRNNRLPSSAAYVGGLAKASPQLQPTLHTPATGYPSSKTAPVEQKPNDNKAVVG